MAKKKREKVASAGPAPVNSPLYDLVAAGDYVSARKGANAVLADAAAPEGDRAIARDVLARTAVEPAALYVALVGISIILVIVALLYLK